MLRAGVLHWYGNYPGNKDPTVGPPAFAFHWDQAVAHDVNGKDPSKPRKSPDRQEEFESHALLINWTRIGLLQQFLFGTDLMLLTKWTLQRRPSKR